MQRETARKCRECADSALALARQAQTVREVRHYLRLAEIWLRLATRFERCDKAPSLSAADELLLLFRKTIPAAYPGDAANTAGLAEAAE